NVREGCCEKPHRQATHQHSPAPFGYGTHPKGRSGGSVPRIVSNIGKSRRNSLVAQRFAGLDHDPQSRAQMTIDLPLDALRRLDAEALPRAEFDMWSSMRRSPIAPRQLHLGPVTRSGPGRATRRAI
ncbi:MAG: hypothetical protein KDA95_02105, partial [Acidimicrobiales bacterium]|nr:hypothetical protein [Acidimicrobiales bacterium]